MAWGIEPLAFVEGTWVWLKIQPTGAKRRFWSMFPLSRASHFRTGFLSHSQMGNREADKQTTATSDTRFATDTGVLNITFQGFLHHVLVLSPEKNTICVLLLEKEEQYVQQG